MEKKITKKLLEKKADLLALETEKLITWCSNCGNYGIQNALMRALVLEEMGLNDRLGLLRLIRAWGWIISLL